MAIKHYRIKYFRGSDQRLVVKEADQWLAKAGDAISIESFNPYQVDFPVKSFAIVICVLVDLERFNDFDE